MAVLQTRKVSTWVAWEAWQGFGNLEIWDPGKNVLIICCLATYIFPLFPSYLSSTSASCQTWRRNWPNICFHSRPVQWSSSHLSAYLRPLSSKSYIERGSLKEIIIIKNLLNFWKHKFCSSCLFVWKLNFSFVFRIDPLQDKANHRPELGLPTPPILRLHFKYACFFFKIDIEKIVSGALSEWQLVFASSALVPDYHVFSPPVVPDCFFDF